MTEDKTYRDGYQDGWQSVTDRQITSWPGLRTGYERGVEDGRRDAEELLRKLYPRSH